MKARGHMTMAKSSNRLSRWLRGATLSLGLGLASAAAQAESLTDALIAAYRHSHILDQQRALLRAADEDVAVSMAALRPVIQFVTNLQASKPGNRLGGASPWELFATMEISASVTLYDNGRSMLATEAAKETVLATREALVNAEQQVLLSAVQAYFDVVSSAETVRLRASNVRLITEQLRAARDRFEVGEVTRTDVAQAESRLALARSQEAAAQGALDVARESYRAAVGRYPKHGLVSNPRAPQIAKSLEAAESIAVRTHPLIRQAQREVTVAELNIARAEAAMKFTVTGNASIGVTEGFQESSSVGIRLTQPIFQGGQLNSLLRQARARRDATRAGLLNTTHQVQQQVGIAWSTLAVARAQIVATDRQIQAATVAFRGVQEELRLGSRTTLDVLDAEQDLLDARVNRVTAVTNQNVAVYQLLSAMGLLTVEQLGLDIQTYDPAAYYNAVKRGPVKHSKQGKQLDSVLKRLNLD